MAQGSDKVASSDQTHVCDSDPYWISVRDALARIDQYIQPVDTIEYVSLRDALGRILADDVVCQVNVPNHTNSAMDGYALSGDELSTDGEVMLTVVGISSAGKPYRETVMQGSCCRIMTGAVMPAGCDTVIPQELVRREEDVIYFDAGQRRGANVRQAGEDMQPGDIVIAAGKRLHAADIGVMASLGQVEVAVKRRIKVGFFSNGDELRSLGESLDIGEVYDSNRHTLHGLLQSWPVEIVDLGVVPDDVNQLKQTLTHATSHCDLVITTAGASVGEADYLQASIREHGQMYFSKVAIKPGRPTAFGQINESYVFALPGNPVSVVVTFSVFVMYALRRLLGETVPEPVLIQAQTQQSLKKSKGRTEYQRGVLHYDAEEKKWWVSSNKAQGSGILTSVSQANCFIVLDEDEENIDQGYWVTVMPYNNNQIL